MGDGERSRGRRLSGSCRELGEGGEPGGCCDEEEGGSEDIPEASAEPAERKRSDLAQNWNCHKSHKFLQGWFCKSVTHFLQTTHGHSSSKSSCSVSASSSFVKFIYF